MIGCVGGGYDTPAHAAVEQPPTPPCCCCWLPLPPCDHHVVLSSAPFNRDDAINARAGGAAVLGRTTPRQLWVMAFLEVLVYCTNEYIGAVKLRAVDMGACCPPPPPPSVQIDDILL